MLLYTEIAAHRIIQFYRSQLERLFYVGGNSPLAKEWLDRQGKYSEMEILLIIIHLIHARALDFIIIPRNGKRPTASEKSNDPGEQPPQQHFQLDDRDTDDAWADARIMVSNVNIAHLAKMFYTI